MKEHFAHLLLKISTLYMMNGDAEVVFFRTESVRRIQQESRKDYIIGSIQETGQHTCVGT